MRESKDNLTRLEVAFHLSREHLNRRLEVQDVYVCKQTGMGRLQEGYLVEMIREKFKEELRYYTKTKMVFLIVFKLLFQVPF